MVNYHENMPGLDLWDKLLEEKPIDRNIIFGEAYGHDIVDKDNPQASLGYLWCIEDGWKLILSYDGELIGGGGAYDFTHDNVRSKPVRLYKILDDPFEKDNLADEFPEKVDELKTKIEAHYPLNGRKLFSSN